MYYAIGKMGLLVCIKEKKHSNTFNVSSGTLTLASIMHTRFCSDLDFVFACMMYSTVTAPLASAASLCNVRSQVTRVNSTLLFVWAL